LITGGNVGRHGSWSENPRARRVVTTVGNLPSFGEIAQQSVCSHQNCCSHTTIKLLGARNKCMNKRWLPEVQIQP
jgi:hypothetical protein